jgi:phytol kinase
MYQNDLVGLAFVYGYVIVLLLFTEKVVSKRYPVAARKFLHIMTGNIAFILPLFATRWIMAFLAAGPFILFTFLMSPYSPVKSLRGKTSEAGHGLGLVYYAITWTVLAYVFFDHREIIAIGILAMSYGDGFASLLGSFYGKRKFVVVRDTRSYFGSLVMAQATFDMILVAVVFYAVPVTSVLLMTIAGIAVVAMIVEAITPFGLDNLSVPFVVSILYWWLVIA